MTLDLKNSGHTAADAANRSRLECLELPHYSPHAQLDALPSLTPQSLEEHLQSSFGLPPSTDFLCQPAEDDDEAAAAAAPSAPEASAALHVSCFAGGNLTTDEATAFYHKALKALHVNEADAKPLPLQPVEEEDNEEARLVSDLPWQALPPHASPSGSAAEGCVQFPPSSHLYRLVAATKEEETNRAVDLCWQLGPVGYALAARSSYSST